MSSWEEIYDNILNVQLPVTIFSEFNIWKWDAPIYLFLDLIKEGLHKNVSLLVILFKIFVILFNIQKSCKQFIIERYFHNVAKYTYFKCIIYVEPNELCCINFKLQFHFVALDIFHFIVIRRRTCCRPLTINKRSFTLM